MQTINTTLANSHRILYFLDLSPTHIHTQHTCALAMLHICPPSAPGPGFVVLPFVLLLLVALPAVMLLRFDKAVEHTASRVIMHSFIVHLDLEPGRKGQ